jgi:V/A-type H+-transporting ATPase subunit F
MKFYLISDNIDTMVGMRLSGISGTLVHEDSEVKEALNKAIADEDVAVILITERLVSLCTDLVNSLKLYTKRPLILEIPDRHGNGRTKNAINEYIRGAIGLKI